MSIDERFAKVVREFRVTFGWSQARLSNECAKRGVKIHPTAITRIEKGDRAISLTEAVALADALFISLDGLLLEKRHDDADAARLRSAFDRIISVAQEARP